MASEQSGETFVSLRQRGKKQAEAGNFKAAVPFFRQAAQVAQSGEVPSIAKEYIALSELSIALFETGDYAGCDEICDSILEFIQKSALDTPGKQQSFQKMQQSTYLRQAKARLYEMKVGEAETALRLLAEGEEKAGL